MSYPVVAECWNIFEACILVQARKLVDDIAKHHNTSLDELQPEYDMGTKVEMEHTTEKDVAMEIARDHLYEDPKYYTKLKKIEKLRYFKKYFI